jgi:hypothetical protein
LLHDLFYVNDLCVVEQRNAILDNVYM